MGPAVPALVFVAVSAHTSFHAAAPPQGARHLWRALDSHRTIHKSTNERPYIRDAGEPHDRNQVNRSHTNTYKYMRHAGLQRSTLLQDDSAIETGGQLTHIHKYKYKYKYDTHTHTNTAQTQNTTRLHKT